MEHSFTDHLAEIGEARHDAPDGTTLRMSDGCVFTMHKVPPAPCSTCGHDDVSVITWQITPATRD